MRRYWVRNTNTDETAVDCYFDSEGRAQCVADALAEETGNDVYEVTG